MTNYKLQITKKKESNIIWADGFTLIETLVAVVVIGVMGLIMSEIIIKSFQSNAKTALIGTIKNNGQVVLNTLDNAIRTSDGVICVKPTLTASYNDTIIIQKSGLYTRFQFFQPSISPPANGYVRQDSSSSVDATTCALGGSPPSISLTSRDVNSGVSITYPTVNPIGPFTKYPTANFKDTINIDFFVGPPVNSPLSFENQVGSKIEFKTTVEVR
jgi:prepilin-type N-terminal cleavage/methylation domain-containing protein